MRKLLISLAILGGAAACADPATPETGPRVLGLSASEVVVGETLGLYGQGLSAEELKAVRVTFRGTFTTDDGRAEDVNLTFGALPYQVVAFLIVVRWMAPPARDAAVAR